MVLRQSSRQGRRSRGRGDRRFPKRDVVWVPIGRSSVSAVGSVRPVDSVGSVDSVSRGELEWLVHMGFVRWVDRREHE
jgi:hypothetical protein